MHFPKVIADENTTIPHKAQRQGRSRVTETTNSKRRRYSPLHNNDGEQNTFTDVRFSFAGAPSCDFGLSVCE